MDSVKPTSISNISIHSRFSQVLADQMTQSTMMTDDPIMLQRRVFAPLSVVLLVKSQLPSSLILQAPDSSVALRQRPRRQSVWNRLGSQRVTQCVTFCRLSGFWSFRNKYRWRTRFGSAQTRAGNLQHRLGQRRLLRSRAIKKLTGGKRLSLWRGGATAFRGRGLGRQTLPTKKQLDNYMSMSKSRLDDQLDDYMSMSKSRLDDQLDDYMSMSKSRLDDELDEYMSMSNSRLDDELDEYMSLARETQL